MSDEFKEAQERKARREALTKEISEQVGKLTVVHDELSRLVGELRHGVDQLREDTEDD